MDVGNNTAALALVIVHHDHRGKGNGRRVMESILDHFKGYESCLVAVEGKSGFYEKMGMKEAGIQVVDYRKVPLKEVKVMLDPDITVASANLVELPEIIKFMAEVHDLDVEKLFHCIIKDPSTECLCAYYKGNIKGVLIYECIESELMMRCFYAENPELAKSLLAECLNRTKNMQKYRLEVPMSNKKNADIVFEQFFRNDLGYMETMDIMSTGGFEGKKIHWDKIYSVVVYSVILPV